MNLWQQIQYRGKAIVAAFGVSVVGLLGWLVQDPQTAKVIEQVLPAPYAQFVPVVLAGIGATWFVHRVRNVTPEPTGADEDDLLRTRAVATIATADGVEVGAGR